MHWVLLMIAIAAEVAGTTFMKLSAGFTKLVPSILLAVSYLVSLSMLNFALKGISMSVAYAIWSGVGTALIVLVGWGGMGEHMSPLKFISILLIIAGVVGLNLGGNNHGATQSPDGRSSTETSIVMGELK